MAQVLTSMKMWSTKENTWSIIQRRLEWNIHTSDKIQQQNFCTKIQSTKSTAQSTEYITEHFGL